MYQTVNARAERLFCSLNPLFCSVLVAVAVAVLATKRFPESLQVLNGAVVIGHSQVTHSDTSCFNCVCERESYDVTGEGR